MSDETLRDTFAAAALTGLLAQGDDGSFSEESYVRAAYRWADAMLRERAKTNHDAAPAAKAVPEPDAVQPNGEGLGIGDLQARFHSAVMDWISEATVAYQTAHPNSIRIMAEACTSCWDAFDRLEYPTDVARPDTNGEVAGGPAHHTQEPVAWAVLLSDGQTYSRCDYRWEADALAAALPANEGVTATVAPLYHSPQPTLTDAERKAISKIYDLLIERSGELQAARRIEESTPFVQLAKALQQMWERLK